MSESEVIITETGIQEKNVAIPNPETIKTKFINNINSPWENRVATLRSRSTNPLQTENFIEKSAGEYIETMCKPPHSESYRNNPVELLFLNINEIHSDLRPHVVAYMESGSVSHAIEDSLKEQIRQLKEEDLNFTNLVLLKNRFDTVEETNWMQADKLDVLQKKFEERINKCLRQDLLNSLHDSTQNIPDILEKYQQINLIPKDFKIDKSFWGTEFGASTELRKSFRNFCEELMTDWQFNENDIGKLYLINQKIREMREYNVFLPTSLETPATEASSVVAREIGLRAKDLITDNVLGLSVDHAKVRGTIKQFYQPVHLGLETNLLDNQHMVLAENGLASGLEEYGKNVNKDRALQEIREVNFSFCDSIDKVNQLEARYKTVLKGKELKKQLKKVEEIAEGSRKAIKAYISAKIENIW